MLAIGTMRESAFPSMVTMSTQEPQTAFFNILSRRDR